MRAAFSSVASVRTPERINARVYHSPRVLRSYTEQRLTPMEAAALLRFQACFYGRDVLDIGIGTGRTSRYLAPLARRYLGIDYSPVMVVYLAARLPEVTVRQMDMCELPGLPDGSFDFVFAPNNVLDAVGHERRLQALGRWRQVLRPGGVLMFSSHNRRYRDALRPPRLLRSLNPLRQAHQLVRYARCTVNFRRLAPERVVNEEFALLTDTGHDYACLHYYISPESQCRQLQACGFSCLEVLDYEGRPLGDGCQLPRGAPGVPESPSLMYLARADPAGD